MKPVSSIGADLIMQPGIASQESQGQGDLQRGKVIWLTGLPGSGKSSIAEATAEKFHLLGYRTVVLDGDKLRQGLNADLGFSIADRNENVRRTAEVAKLFRETGPLVFVALVSPVRQARDKARQLSPPADFLEIYCNCDVAVCRSRDPKGHYAKAESGQIPEFTGVSSPYEAPVNPELVLNTSSESIEASVARLARFLLDRLGTKTLPSARR